MLSQEENNLEMINYDKTIQDNYQIIIVVISKYKGRN